MSNLGKWEKFYRDIKKPVSYGDSSSYQIGAEFLSDCKEIEDWGCGMGWFRQYVGGSTTYIGVDGSKSIFADKVEDLEEYVSETEGLFMRHVLEHNDNWQRVFSNALKSFTKKMVLVIFTPWNDGPGAKKIGYSDDYGVADYSFSKSDIEEFLAGFTYEVQEIDSPETYYGKEYVILIEKQ